MSTLPFYTPIPEFRAGDLLSATRLNQMLTNMDAVYGLDQQMVFGTYFGRNDEVDNEWKGWVAYKGDTLVIRLQSQSEVTHVAFDRTAKTETIDWYFPAGTSGVQTLAIPQDRGYVDYELYQVYVWSEACPLYAYMTVNADWSLPPALPTFENGTLSDHDDLNVILTVTDSLAQWFNQPVASGLSWSCVDGGWLNDQGQTYLNFYAPYRHTKFQFFMSAVCSSGNPQGSDHLYWRVRDNTGNLRQFWAYTLPHGGEYAPVEPIVIRLPDYADLTVNSWYQFQYEHQRDGNSNEDGITRLYWYGQQRDSTAVQWDAQYRWEAGGTVYGDSGGPPQLDTMATNATYLYARKRFVNPVMHQSTQNRGIDHEGRGPMRTFSRRIHRWLAYEASDEEHTPTLYYSVHDPKVLNSFDLTTSFSTLYLDLEDTPIKPGMLFYTQYCNYAIQVPDHP